MLTMYCVQGLLVGSGLGWLCWGVALSVLLVLVLVLWMGGEGGQTSATTSATGTGLLGAKGGWDENEFDEF